MESQRVRYNGVTFTFTYKIDNYQAPRSMGFSRQEYWSGMPLLTEVPGYSISFLHLSEGYYICNICNVQGFLLVQLHSHVQLFVTHRLQPTSSSVPGILHARLLEWVAIPFSKESS